ncbi:Hsp70 family protein [Metarhizium robertsii ARSEF 23]|uniref:Hsp70 family protein n=1 Tax=Metarhizium robertsii (strain ARSEF 23 / ATCC MYA-3075) TaxID=655844 RepID=E9EZZ6_METRA|nr:Hsp70 family protein [Metarhizium robertsii ARSEF 23]EFY98456.2 Hsp70 family protein [Metarhizium robertsii ARSEF 23]
MVRKLKDEQMPRPTMSESDEKLVIALDFGTTYSGVAFCFANQDNTKPAAIMDWPGDHGISVPKIPTVVAYGKQPHGFFKWGASVAELDTGIIGIKLLLDPEQERPTYLPSTNAQRDIRMLPKQPVEIAADFMGAIYKHALDEISKTVPKAYMDLCSKEFVLSVPAVWSDAAKNATLLAAKRAGIHPVTLIKEPEAAALHTVKTLDFSIKKGDAFVVCDAGGGTVDLISYEVHQVVPNLQVKEIVPGTGGMAGSMGLNQRFAQAVQNLIGDEQWFPLKKSKAWAIAQRQFDQEVKKAFRGDPDEEYFVNFPMADLEDDPQSGLVSNTWRMTGSDLARIFNPLIEDVLKLIELQVQASKLKRPGTGVSGIMLVGGFGSSRYLMLRAKSRFPDIQVLQPQDAWAAIVKGAVLSKIPGQASVMSTSSTKHYGTSMDALYSSAKDWGQPTFIRRDGSTGVEKMAWFINKGEDIQRDHKIKFSFFRTLEKGYTNPELIFRDKLYECQDSLAPIYPSAARNMRENCSVRADLTSIPKSYLIKKKDPHGVAYYEVHYNLVISLESAIMTFSLEVDGKTMGSVNVDYK